MFVGACVCKVYAIELAKISVIISIMLNNSKIAGILVLSLSHGNTFSLFSSAIIDIFFFFFLCLFNGILVELCIICHTGPLPFSFKMIFEG